MKNITKGLFLLVLLLCLFVSCVSFGSKDSDNLFITFVDDNSDFDYRNVTVFIDGKPSGSFRNGETKAFNLSTGDIHRIYFEYKNKYFTDRAGWNSKSTSVDTVTLQNNTIHHWLFQFYIREGNYYYDFSETKTEAKSSPLSGTSIKGIEAAAIEAAQKLMVDLPENAASTLAVISIASSDRDAALFVIDELEYQLVNSRLFTTVDRNAIDAIRTERNFQFSGEVSDESAVSIGNMLGANIVITGSITGVGNLQRLTVKALDVKTAQILSMARIAIH